MLTVQNAQLEAQVASEGRNERLHELEQAMADIQAENARLQVSLHVSESFPLSLADRLAHSLEAVVVVHP